MNDPIINALRAEQSRLAIESLKRPKAASSDSAMSYEYGYMAGTFAGCERAIERVLALYRDDKEDELDGQRAELRRGISQY